MPALRCNTCHRNYPQDFIVPWSPDQGLAHGDDCPICGAGYVERIGSSEPDDVEELNREASFAEFRRRYGSEVVA